MIWHFDRKQFLLVSLVALVVLNAPRGYAQSSTLPVVPGAFGYGMATRAAYGCGSNPTMYRVTNLNDAGSGSLRTALTATEPRFVIFEVSGYINLLTPIFINSPCLTVAGQTAPSPGITIRSAGQNTTIEIYTHDVLFQHLRIRPGDATCNSGIGAWDETNAYNLVFDHLSASWAQDENFYIKGHDVTYWRSIASEGLFQAPGSGSCSGGGLANGHGLLINEGSRNVAVLQSLFASNLERNPLVKGNTTSYLANNVAYGQNQGTFFVDPDFTGPLSATVVGNYYRRDATGEDYYAIATRHMLAGSRMYLNGNGIDDGGLLPVTEPFTVINGDGIDPRVGTPPITLSGYQPLTAAASYALVLASAGARPMDRDAVDARIVQAVQNRSSSIIQTVAQAGGYPSLAVNPRALTLPTNPHAVTSSGYTNLELWLQSYAAALESPQTTTTLTPPTGVRIAAQ